MTKRLSRLFEDPPEKWGLRGDPQLWDEMRHVIDHYPFPTDVDELEIILKKCFKDLTGQDMVEGGQVYVERYNAGGMSGGFVDCGFWTDRGMPLLSRRFEKLRT